MWLSLVVSYLVGIIQICFGLNLFYHVIFVLLPEGISCGWLIYLTIIADIILGISIIVKAYNSLDIGREKYIDSRPMNPELAQNLRILVVFHLQFLVLSVILLAFSNIWSTYYIHLPIKNLAIRYTFEKSKVIREICGGEAKSKFVGSIDSNEVKYGIYCKDKKMSATYYPSSGRYEINDAGVLIRFSADVEGYSGDTSTHGGRQIVWKVKDAGIAYLLNPL